MAAPIVELADDLVSKLATATGYTFARRMGPYLQRDDLDDGGRWIVVAAGDEQTAKARQVDRSTLIVDVAYQEALPESTDAAPNPLENLSWLDARMERVENVKNAFRGEGSLRDADWPGDLVFVRMTNSPIYRPDILTDYQIFTAVIRLEFVGELESL